MANKNTVAYHYNKANELAINKIKYMARTILFKHNNLDEFVMGMGGWFFTDKSSCIIHSSNSNICPKYMTGLRNFISKWDTELKLTGTLMRFTAKGKVITGW
jgi:hypothetical protein